MIVSGQSAARPRITSALCAVCRWALRLCEAKESLLRACGRGPSPLPFRMGHRKGKGFYLEYSRAFRPDTG